MRNPYEENILRFLTSAFRDEETYLKWIQQPKNSFTKTCGTASSPAKSVYPIRVCLLS